MKKCIFLNILGAGNQPQGMLGRVLPASSDSVFILCVIAYHVQAMHNCVCVRIPTEPRGRSEPLEFQAVRAAQCGCWGLSWDPLQEQAQSLFIPPELSVQPCFSYPHN